MQIEVITGDGQAGQTGSAVIPLPVTEGVAARQR